jgi:hypothetical protein
MENNLRREDAEAVVQLLMRHSKEFNDFIEERKGKISAEEFSVLKKMFGKLMGAIYFEVIEVLQRDHKGIMDEIYAPFAKMKFEFPKSGKQ